MQPSDVRYARSEAILRWEDGDLPGARAALDQLIDQLTPVDAQLKLELAHVYVDRASVARTENDWATALADLASAAALAGELPLLARKPLLVPIYQLEVKIRATEYASVFDLGGARSVLERLAALNPDAWIVEE